MIELGPGADLLRMVGGIFWLVVIGAVVAAALIPKTKTSKAIAGIVVVVLFLAFPGRWAWEMKRETDAKGSRLAKAEAMFQERCKTAGEKIYRTVDGVEGILLMKVRPKEDNFGEQYRMDDPYGDDLGGDGYIETFLRARDEKGHLAATVVGGYRYVDVIDATDGKRYRYTGRTEEPWQTDKHYLKGYIRFVLDKAPTTAPSPRYGVTYDDISTLDDREYWIAGSSLRVIDLQTNEVIAERIGYMMDRGQGAIGQGGSHPAWGRARKHACPPHPAPHQARNFVERGLKTIKEN